MATSLSQEEINFLRLARLLLRIAPRAIRKKFDYEFDPTKIQQFLRKHRNKIYDLTDKTQYGILYPTGSSGVSSESFDITLMTCLLKHFTELDIHDRSLPVQNINTAAADISRIKYYRNYIVHEANGKVNEIKFIEIWNCAAGAILRLEPDLKSDVHVLVKSSLSDDRDIIDFVRLEKEMEINKQYMRQKLEPLEIENNNIREIHNSTFKEWRDIDKKYITTSATTFIFQSLNQNRGVIITGSPGCGKSAAAHHVALILEKKGYEIILCTEPSEIMKYHTKEKTQVFVIDDICGKFALNQHKADSWEQNDGKLNMLIDSFNQNDDKEDSSNNSKTKFIITCRENIYSHKAFPKLTFISFVQCSFSLEYKISPDEMRNIALSYVPENTVNHIGNICLYDFFPLLCALYCKKTTPDPYFFSHPIEIIEQEIIEMKVKSEISFLCLSLLVLKNNKCCKDEFRSLDVEHLVKDICWDAKIESIISMVSIQTCFGRLKGIYIIETENIYTAIHDKMFDIIAAAIAPSIIKCLIKHGDIRFLSNRIQLVSLGRSSLPFAVIIPQEFERHYLKRIYKETMRGKYWEVFGGLQAENKTYRNLLLSFLTEQGTCQEISYVTSDDGPTPLFVSSSLGYIDFVEYFIVKCHHHAHVTDKEGRSPFYIACKNGHIAVVKQLIKYYEDVNAEMVYKTTTLSAACFYGHTEVAKLLLDNNADINRTNKNNQNALYHACLNGNVQLLSLLFSAYNLDITSRDTHDQTTILTACQKGHTQTFKYRREFCRDVNQQSDLGWTPLFIACFEGHYETVKLLLDLNGQTLNSCVDTKIKDNKGNSILHAACTNGHAKVVKLLIDVSMNVNDITNNGVTPLFAACQNGNYDTVKLLLDIKGETFNSCVDTTILSKDGWSDLHVACEKGHTEVVKLLIDVGLNVNEQTNALHTPLGLACYHGHYETVKYLLCANGKTLDNRVDIKKKIQKGWSVLHLACCNGHTEIVKLLIDVGCNLNEINDKKVTPMYLACTNGHYDTVKLLISLNGKLLESRENATIKYQYGLSSLQGACSSGHTEIVKVLVDFGMNLNVKLDARRTPLYLACENGHYNTVKFLLDLNGQKLNSRVDIIIKDRNGKSVLHIACLNGHTEVVTLLTDVGLNLNDTTNNGCTPLYLACHNGHTDIVKYLLDLNGDILNSRVDTKIKDEDGMSVLHAACSKGHKEVVKLLIDVGMNVNDISNKGYTSLYLLCQNGYYETVKFLLDLNGQQLNSCVDTTIKDEDGWSVLHAACSKGHTAVVKILIDVGMNVNDISNKGLTPLFIAILNGHYDTVKFLRDRNNETSRTHDMCLYC